MKEYVINTSFTDFEFRPEIDVVLSAVRGQISSLLGPDETCYLVFSNDT